MRGDIVLYKAQPGNLFDWIITQADPGGKGPFCHVEVELGNGLFVGEHSNGLTVHLADKERDLVFVSPHGDLDKGLEWVNEQIALAKKDQDLREYGNLDLMAEALRVLGADWHMSDPGAWDCSDFVTRYLVAANAAEPLGNKANDPATVSPNDLARAFRVI